MLRSSLALIHLFLTLAVAGDFSKTCGSIIIVEQNPILKANCLSVERAQRTSTTDLNTCLPCEHESSRCRWDSCELGNDTIAQCRTDNTARSFRLGMTPVISNLECMLKIVLDDYITNLDGDLFCDYPLCTPGNYDCRGSQVLVCDVSGVWRPHRLCENSCIVTEDAYTCGG
jgi:hypothetical protein